MFAGPHIVSRRQLMAALAALSVGCTSEDGAERTDDGPPKQNPTNQVGTYADNLDALLDVLLPAERDEAGTVISPGAREVGAGALLDVDEFIPLAQTQGFIPPLPADIFELLDGFDTALRVALNADLDVLAGGQAALTPFRDLVRVDQETVVERAFADPTRAPLYAVVRAAAFAAYLGAGKSDMGLVTVGYPPFEDYTGGVAVSGYPRMIDGVVDDYSYNLNPAPTAGVDLALVLNDSGDFY